MTQLQDLKKELATTSFALSPPARNNCGRLSGILVPGNLLSVSGQSTNAGNICARKVVGTSESCEPLSCNKNHNKGFKQETAS